MHRGYCCQISKIPFWTCAFLEIKLGDTGCDTLNDHLNSCEDPNAVCDTGAKCVCKEGYSDDNGADTRLGTCRPSKLDN